MSLQDLWYPPAYIASVSAVDGLDTARDSESAPS
jgi:hypothetical protein